MEAVTVLEIAQRFNAGSFITSFSSPIGTKELFCRPVRDLFQCVFGFRALKALCYCQRIAHKTELNRKANLASLYNQS